MSGNDLVNLRWQYIRSIEVGQLQQQEIINLKLQLRNQCLSSQALEIDSKKKRNHMVLKKQDILQQIKTIKSEMESMKIRYSNEVAMHVGDIMKLK